MEKIRKPVSASLAIKSEILLPNDTNTIDNLMGGRLMHWMDVVGGICAQRHSQCLVVTASVDNISFTRSIPLGNVVTMEAKVTRAFNTSMEVHIVVWSEDLPNGHKVKSNTAFLTYVAVDKNGQPLIVPEAIPETEEEQTLYEGALQRRQLRLLLAGRIKPEEAPELRTIFYP
ncbi:MAG: acyl-CoA thioesterase [Cyclobacteriaceae bacterium]